MRDEFAIQIMRQTSTAAWHVANIAAHVQRAVHLPHCDRTPTKGHSTGPPLAFRSYALCYHRFYRSEQCASGGGYDINTSSLSHITDQESCGFAPLLAY